MPTLFNFSVKISNPTGTISITALIWETNIGNKVARKPNSNNKKINTTIKLENIRLKPNLSKNEVIGSNIYAKTIESAKGHNIGFKKPKPTNTVSYTHLTLPTKA